MTLRTRRGCWAVASMVAAVLAITVDSLVFRLLMVAVCLVAVLRLCTVDRLPKEHRR